MTNEQILGHALHYAKEYEWPVFPLEAGEKTPKIPQKDGGHGCLDASTSPDQLMEWWARYAGSNIGIHCTKVWVLDVDDKNGHNGSAELEKLEAKHGKLPKTLMQASPTGGRHYFFNKTKSGIKIKNKAGFLPGLDTRSECGYVAVEPSWTDAGEYRWINPGTPVADAPDWLLNLVKDKANPNREKLESHTGSRDVDDASLAGHLHNLGFNQDEMFRILKMRNDNLDLRNEPQSDVDLRRVVESISKRERHALKSPEQTEVIDFGNFSIDDLPNLEDLEIPPREFLIDGILEKGQIGALAADSESGKSLLALSWCHHIVNGIPWCGRKTQQTHALILDRENGQETMIRRMALMNVKGHGRLKVMSIKKLIEGQPTSFDVELTSRIILEHAEKYPGCLIVVDSLRAWLREGMSENHASDIRPFFNTLRKLQAFGTSVLVIHHFNRQGTFSGSTDIKASLDYGFTIEPTKDPVSRLLTAVTLNGLKQREPLSNALTFKFDGHKFEQEAPRLVKVNAKQAKMIEILQARPGVTQSRFLQAAQALGKGITKPMAKEFLEDNIENGNIRVDESGQSFKHYWQPPAVQKRLDDNEEAA